MLQKSAMDRAALASQIIDYVRENTQSEGSKSQSHQLEKFKPNANNIRRPRRGCARHRQWRRRHNIGRVREWTGHGSYNNFSLNLRVDATCGCYNMEHNVTNSKTQFQIQGKITTNET